MQKQSTKIFLILILSFFTVTAFAQEYPDSGFTNKAEAKNLMVNGLKEGKWVWYYDSEMNIIKDTNAYPSSFRYVLAVFKNDLPFGIWRWYEKGSLITLIPYTNGKMNGVVKYYGGGKLYDSEKPFSNGLANGIAKIYYDNGQIKNETPHVNDTIEGGEKEYYESGKLKQETPYSKGKKNGVGKEYYENGVLKSETPYTDDKFNGVYKTYYEDGKLKSEAPWSNGRLFGIAKSYSEDGEIIKKSPFLNSKPMK